MKAHREPSVDARHGAEVAPPGSPPRHEAHPAAALFPRASDAELREMADDIGARGLDQPVVIHAGKILDGRNRLLACEMADVAPRFEEYAGGDPVGYVVAANLKRRHLDASQRAMIAGRLANLSRGDNQHAPIGATSNSRAAKLLNIGAKSVERARAVLGGAPELVAAVEQGKVAVSIGAVIAKAPHVEQREVIARGEKEIVALAKAIKQRDARAKFDRKQKDIAAIAGRSAGPLPSKTYPVLLVDPPWLCTYERAAPPYPTMPTERIAAMKLPAAPNAVLFLWAISRLLDDAIDVMKDWGFSYRSSFVWVKGGGALGSWNCMNHEFLLVGIRGDFPPPLPESLFSSVIEAPRREHSRKPDEAYQIIERAYPTLPKIELFARRARDGWASWGNQAPSSTTQAKSAGSTSPRSRRAAQRGQK